MIVDCLIVINEMSETKIEFANYFPLKKRLIKEGEKMILLILKRFTLST